MAKDVCTVTLEYKDAKYELVKDIPSASRFTVCTKCAAGSNDKLCAVLSKHCKSKKFYFKQTHWRTL